MTVDESIDWINKLFLKADFTDTYGDMEDTEPYEEAIKTITEVLKQVSCKDCVSRHTVLEIIEREEFKGDAIYEIEKLSSVASLTKIGHCKDCKYFEYDSVSKVDRIPLIVAHEICSKWGNGCKTKEDGYCFLFESVESEDKK